MHSIKDSALTLSGVVFAILLALMPFTTSQHLFFGAVNAKYFLIIAAVLLLALYFSYLLISGKHHLALRGRWLLLFLGISLGVLYLASFVGVYPERSLFSDIIRSSGVLFLTAISLLAFIGSELLTLRDWSVVRRAVAGSAALFAFLTILGSEGLALSGRILTVNLEIDGLTMGNSTFAGTYLLIAFVITLIEFFKTDQRRAKYVLGALAFVQLLSPTLFNIQILLGNVSSSELLSSPFAFVGTAQASSVAVFAVVGYMLGLFLIQKFISKKPSVNMLWSSVWLVGILASIGLLFVPGSIVQEQIIERSTSARILVWDSALGAIKERPLLGWGPENFRVATDEYFDNRLYLDENVGEIWFDRAHNLVLDTLVSVGVFGLIAFMLLAAYFVLVSVRAARAGIIGWTEASLLGALVVAHMLQLQTSFDTVTTYVFVGAMLGYGLWLERRLVSSIPVERDLLSKGIASILVVLAVVGSAYLFFGEYSRQRALFGIFVTTEDRNQQIDFIHAAMSRSSDFEALRLASASLVRGFFGELSAKEKERNVTILKGGMEQLNIFGDYWRIYLEKNPDDYRARMNYAYQLLILSTLGGDDHFDEAKMIIANSYELSPGNPLTYILDGLAALYAGDIAVGKEKMKQALALNPDIPLLERMVVYAQEQEASFPTITILRLENL